MDDFIRELKRNEELSIIKVMAFMSYNPSIGRVLAKGGVNKFQNMAVQRVKKLRTIKGKKKFDVFHDEWVQAE